MYGETGRITIVGAGGRGRHWVQAAFMHPRWRVAALVDVDGEALEQAAEAAGVPADCCFDQLEEALTSAPSDAVLIAVPMAHHYACIRSSLEAGRHVLTEKPFVTETAQARELVALAGGRHLALGVAHNYRYEPAYQVLGQAINSGLIGRVLSVSIRFHRHRPVRGSGFNEPAPFLFIQGIHFLDALRGLFGCEGDSVQACSLNPPWSPYQNAARWEALVTMRNGVLAHLSGSFLGRGRQTPYRGQWRVEGKNGDLYLDEGHDEQMRLVHVWDDGRAEERLPLAEGAPPEEVLLEQFFQAYSRGTEMPTSGRDNLGTLALVEAIVAAAESGHTERVRAEED